MPKQPGEIYEQARDSVVVVRTESGGGSGVVVGENEVVTNCHVVDDGSPIGVEKLNPNGEPEGKPVQARVAAANMGDLCLLHVRGLRAKPVSIGSAKELRVGDAVYAMGTPKEWPLTFSGGLVSQLRGNLESPHIQTDAAISQGSSGGGLFNDEGQLVGIPHRSMEGQNLNFALPIEWVKDLRERAPKETKLRALWESVKAAPSIAPDALRHLAFGIVDLHEPPDMKAPILGKIAREEARMGNKALAGSRAALILELPEAEDSGGADRILVEAAWSMACAGNFTEAMGLAGKVRDGVARSLAFAVIAAEQAKNGDAAAARSVFDEKVNSAPQEFGSEFWLVAWALAEMGDFKGALMCAQETYDEAGMNPSLGVCLALVNIACAMARQDLGVGAGMAFNFVRGELDQLARRSPESMGFRAFALGEIAWGQAECGYRQAALESVNEAVAIIENGGLEAADYKHKIHALARVACVYAKARDLDSARRALNQIPVLDGDLAIALGYLAGAMEAMGMSG